MHHLPTRRSRLAAAVVAGALALGLVAATAAPASAAPSAASFTITATPSVTVGDTVQVSLAALDVVDAYSYAITVTFDPAAVAYVSDSASAGPAGGFDAVSTTAGSVTVVHTRRGTSPALTGDLAVSLGFIGVGAGATTITATASLLDATGATTPAPLTATARVAVVAPALVPSPAPTPSASSAPAAGGSTPTPAASRAARNADGSLAATGADSATLLTIAALALAALAAGFVVVRRRAASSR
jgi:LPXTG-motif cell wall-anchored protein